MFEQPVAAATGHRPDKIGGYDYAAPKRVWIRGEIKRALRRIRPQYCISGMALGVDQDFAWTCVELAIPFVAAIPFVGQESNWPKESQKIYRELLSKAYCIYVVCDVGYASWKMQARNEWMVNNADQLIAVWDGSDGGTGNCVRYAWRTGQCLITRINPNDFG